MRNIVFWNKKKLQNLVVGNGKITVDLPQVAFVSFCMPLGIP